VIQRSLARLPLWARLAAAVLLLVTIAVTAIGAAGVAVLRGQLLDRIDAQLRAVADSPPSPSAGKAYQRRQDPDDRTPPLAGGTGVYRQEQRDADGQRVRDGQPRTASSGGADVPEDAHWLDAHTGRPTTVPGRAGDADWRVLVQPLEGAAGWSVVAVSLGDLDETINQLVRIDLTVGATGLLLLAVVSVVIVRVNLRPLATVEQTAAAIAAGDLSQRVPQQPPRTELGRLGGALNGMLAQIEAAFRDRAESETTARQSEERMRRFVSDAGHELRTPLSVIRAWAEHVHRGPYRDSAELERILSTVGEEATRMGTLVEDLLLLARMDQQRPLDRQPVDVLALALDAVRDARLLAPGREIRLAVDDRASYTVTGDELRLRQVLSNLTSNARMHTTPGTPVSITLGPGRLGAAPAVVLDVTDQGPGLTPEQAERIFERFYRTDSSRTRRTGGSGLGLAIVASLTAAHGGTATVHTSPGAGTTFRITLPLAGAGASSATTTATG
jgi:two-component system OmpR family sensor kinase